MNFLGDTDWPGDSFMGKSTPGRTKRFSYFSESLNSSSTVPMFDSDTKTNVPICRHLKLSVSGTGNPR